MKVLIFDHHFRSDIDALVQVAGPSDIVRVVSAELFASRARRIFPLEVFGADLAVFSAPEFASERAAYRVEARSLVFSLYKAFPFDVFVVPNDTYFYVRDVIDTVRELGIPTIAVQKESGVSVTAIANHAAEVGRWFPVCVDLMTVCSELSKTFWVAAGADPENVLVLGQPRFDIYAKGSAKLPGPQPAVLDRKLGKPVLLFLSYDLDAYDETRTDQTRRPWEQLHLETEQALIAVARAGLYSVFVKPHPQQRAAELQSLTARLSGVPGMTVLPNNLDTRQLISESDVVVGFQTTAIAEAMIAGKRTIYTFWTSNAERVSHGLLPFHEMTEAIEVATSAENLESRLRRPQRELNDSTRMLRETYCEPYLGRVDGQASARVWAALHKIVIERSSRPRPLAYRLSGESAAYCADELRIARVCAAVWAGTAAGLMLVWWTKTARRTRARLRGELARARECSEFLAGQYRRFAVLRGPRADGLIGTAKRVVGPAPVGRFSA